MPHKLSVEQKLLSGTLRKHREAPPSTSRTPESVKKDIADVREGIAAMHQNLRLATADILKKGMSVTTVLTDSHGKTFSAERANPAFKVQRDALAALRSFKKYLAILEAELAAAEDADDSTSPSAIAQLIENARRASGR
jgi:hypothetical protein